MKQTNKPIEPPLPRPTGNFWWLHNQLNTLWISPRGRCVVHPAEPPAPVPVRHLAAVRQRLLRHLPSGRPGQPHRHHHHHRRGPARRPQHHHQVLCVQPIPQQSGRAGDRHHRQHGERGQSFFSFYCVLKAACIETELMGTNTVSVRVDVSFLAINREDELSGWTEGTCFLAKQRGCVFWLNRGWGAFWLNNGDVLAFWLNRGDMFSG